MRQSMTLIRPAPSASPQPMTSLSLARRAALLGLISTVGPLAIDMYLPAFPAMARDLHCASSSVQLSLVVFFCAMAVGQLVYGPLSDAYGRKPPLVFGLGLFAAATLGCALAPDINTLLVLRVLQGLGACSGMTIARAVVRDQLTGADAAKLLSLMILVWGVSPLFALLLCAYPIFETIFTIYRRKLKGASASHPDGIHLHSLVHRRLIRPLLHESPEASLRTRNSMTSPYLWLLCSLSVIPAMVWWRSSAMLAACIVLFIVSYTAVYWGIVRFKVPRWLVARH